MFLRESESIRNKFSDDDFDDIQQQNQPNNQTICVNQQTDNNVSEDFSDLIQLNQQLHSPTSVSMVESCENGDIRLNIISNPPNANDKQDKNNCQEVNDNTQFKIIPQNLNATIQPSQIYFVKNVNGMTDVSPFIVVRKPDQTATTHQIEEHHHFQPEEQQQQPQTIKQPITLTTTTHTSNITRQTNDLINPLLKNNIQPKNKKKKDDAEEELDANDYFGRMIASLLKEFNQEERKSIRLAVLQLITNWSHKKGNNHLDNNK